MVKEQSLLNVLRAGNRIMTTGQRSHQFKAAWIILAHQIIYLLAFVDSFSTHIIRTKTTNRCHRDVASQSFSTPTGPYSDRRGKKLSLVELTASMSSDAGSDSESSSPSATVEEPINEDEQVLDMPWSDVQEWALEDNLSKFTVIVPPPITGGRPRTYAMWRTLTREVPELAGYPVAFLLRMHRRSMKKKSSSSTGDDSAVARETPGVLPMVDDFEFASNGGISGRAYGLPGIADGTRIQTPPLVSAETTVPRGYVTAQGGDSNDSEDNAGDIGFSYELGTCASSSAYSLDGTDRAAALAAARRLVVEGAAGSSEKVVEVAKDMAVTGSGLLSDADANRDLVYLGGATAMLLASASAVGMLSHHLTVNVFWV